MALSSHAHYVRLCLEADEAACRRQRRRDRPPGPDDETRCERVAEMLGTTVAQVRARDRHQHVVAARQVAAWLLSTVWGLSQGHVGRLLMRDRTTITVALARLERRRQADPAFDAWVQDLARRLR